MYRSSRTKEKTQSLRWTRSSPLLLCMMLSIWISALLLRENVNQYLFQSSYSVLMLVTMSAEGLCFLKIMTLCQSFPCCDDQMPEKKQLQGGRVGSWGTIHCGREIIQAWVWGSCIQSRCICDQEAEGNELWHSACFFLLFSSRDWSELAFTANWTQPRSPGKTGSVRDCLHQVSLWACSWGLSRVNWHGRIL